MNTPSKGVTRWIVIGLVVAVVIVLGAIWIGRVAGVSSTGNEKEASLNAAYGDGANYLSTCITQTHQAANVANANAEAFDRVIKDAIAGNGKANVDLKSSAGQNSFFPMLVQAYPQLNGQTDLFSKVVTIIVGCQTDFRNKQSYVQDRVRVFDSWRLDWWNDFFGSSSFPNDNLIVSLPGVIKVVGKDALDKMRQPIITADTGEAYKGGIYTPSDPFPVTPQPTR